VRDSVQLKRDSDHKPKIQTFVVEDDYDEEPEQREYFSAVDKSRLDYHKHLDIWVCGECFQQYDPKIQDTPIKDKSGFKLYSHAGHNPYATFDESDPYQPFVEGIDIEAREREAEGEGVEIIRSSPDQRVQTIRVKGNLADALHATSSTKEI
jgi:hypothetical protein